MCTSNSSELDLELGDLLQEFNDVVKELSEAQTSDHVLRNVKRHTGLSDGDDSDYCSEASLVNSLNASQEELNTVSTTTGSKAKLGDTSDLQSFIENLDKELAEM
ncbi:regulator of cell cycle RGCC-like [Danio rerio]|uniref:Regulator of cell cycle RGCC-like n=1 Tax=Danio rerio TaxID=7955 RepID=A0A0R4IE30_DANRE|nr:regulator of cell cycle RGCC-like [Danio rerio]|eukprot:XP_001344817.1 regulator of cell cycle RGCC [Danio rerio]